MISSTKDQTQTLCRIEECRVFSVDKDTKLVSVQSVSGRVYKDSVSLHSSMSPNSNSNAGVNVEPKVGDYCVVMIDDIKSTAYIVGYFDPFHDTNIKRKDYAGGDWIFSNGKSYHSVEFRRNGLIKLKSNPMCQIIMNPEDSSLKVFSKRMLYYKDSLNYMTFDYHEDDDDRESDVVFHLGVHSSKDNALTATKAIQEPEFVLRIGKTKFDGVTPSGSELKDFDDDALFKMKVENYDPTGNVSKVKTVVSIGETSDKGYWSLDTEDVLGNMFSESIMRDDAFRKSSYRNKFNAYLRHINLNGNLLESMRTQKWTYDSLVESTGFSMDHSAGVKLVAKEKIYTIHTENLYIGDDSKKHPLAKGDVVINLLDELYDAIFQMVINSPTGPCEPGPTLGTEIAFNKWKKKIKKLKSQYHYMNG